MTQCERILRHLQDFWDLKAQGVPIKSETVTGKNRYGERTCFARYSLEHAAGVR